MTNKKKILIVSYGLDIGGVERSLIGLLNAFDYTKYDVDLFLFAHDGEFMNMINKKVNLLPANEMMQYIKKPIVEVFRAGFFKLGMIRLRAKLISKCTEMFFHRPGSMMLRVFRDADKYFLDIDKQYDIALGFHAPFDFLLNHTNSKKKIGWVHTDYTKISVDPKYELVNWEQLTCIAAVSEACMNSFIKVFPSVKDKMIVIENILQPDFVRQQADLIDVSDEMKKCEGEFVLCTIGRYCEPKAFEWAIEACAKLIREDKKIRWYAIGYGPYERMLKDMVKDKKLGEYFVFLDKKSNPYPYMKACDIYVQGSRYEGKAVTVREAQVLGKPVLITNFETSKSQLANGIDGHICNLSVDGIIAGVKLLIEDEQYRQKIINGTMLNDYGNQHEVEKIYQFIK